MKNKYNTREYSTPIQLKLPVDLERIIKVSDPVYPFSEVMDHMGLNKSLAFGSFNGLIGNAKNKSITSFQPRIKCYANCLGEYCIRNMRILKIYGTKLISVVLTGL